MTLHHRLDSQELVATFDALREGIQVIDREWRYLYVNAAAAAHGRKAREELLGRTMLECYPGIERTELFAQLSRCMEERAPASLQNQFTYPDGKRRDFDLRVQPCDVGLVVLSIDVTEERKLEAQFRHAQKMEAVGRLAGGVAHDFNNLLTVILSYSAIVLRDLDPKHPLQASIEPIQKAGERAAELTRQLLAFSRQQVLVPEVLDLNDVLRESEKMLGRVLGEDIAVVMHYAEPLSRVKVDAGQMDQVVMNLAVNARDAMPGGGTLTIETGDVVLDESYTSEHLGVRPGPYVMLAVSDTGSGMDKETQARMFEPFFTTKDTRGTGLGLSTVFGIVQQSGGTIWVYSEPGVGTTFKVYFPRAGDEEPAPREAPRPVTLQGTETVLLVEDQEEVRRVVREILRRFGYQVLEAGGASEACMACELHAGTIHLLLTDVVMPQMNGRELAERLLELRPDMQVLYMSGYTESAVIGHAILDSGIAYLQKPIVPEALARRVREVLDAPAPRSGSGSAR